MFQSAPPHGGRPRCGDCFRRARRFNPRPRTGGDLSARLRNVDIMTFQSAPPHGGRHETVLVLGLIRLFQSAPPHGGRRAEDRARDDWKCVSIRAPARGATHRYVPYDRVMGFQSAPPHGGRRSAASLLVSNAPPHGGRLGTSFTLAGFFSFNPRPRTGGDWPRLQHGQLQPSFNPRPRTGGDLVLDRVGQRRHVSIRAPARGATPARRAVSAGHCFNPRPRTGGDVWEQ